MTSKTEELKALQEQLKEKLVEINKDLEELLKNDNVKKYIEINDLMNEIYQEIPKLDLKISKAEMSECNHIWIISNICKEWDGHRNNNYEYHTCIKCGLSTMARDKAYDKYFATPLDKIMVTILDEYGLKGTKTNIICSYELANSIYNKIKTAHPDITDEQVVNYLECSLYNIRSNKVTEKAVENRVKRLELSKNFNKWHKKDVIN